MIPQRKGYLALPDTTRAQCLLCRTRARHRMGEVSYCGRHGGVFLEERGLLTLLEDTLHSFLAQLRQHAAERRLEALRELGEAAEDLDSGSDPQDLWTPALAYRDIARRCRVLVSPDDPEVRDAVERGYSVALRTVRDLTPVWPPTAEALVRRLDEWAAYWHIPREEP